MTATDRTLSAIMSHMTHPAPKFVIRCWSHSTRFMRESFGERFAVSGAEPPVCPAGSRRLVAYSGASGVFGGRATRHPGLAGCPIAGGDPGGRSVTPGEPKPFPDG